jgi:hypothetical protein
VCPILILVAVPTLCVSLYSPVHIKICLSHALCPIFKLETLLYYCSVYVSSMLVARLVAAHNSLAME